MKKNYFFNNLLFLLLILTFLSCGPDDENQYTEVSPVVVVVDLTQVPYPKLSDYKFFEGEMKNQEPAYKVIPYDLNSMLFTDYAHKKRFIWMPEGQKATYNADGKILNFPSGTVLIKSFYYENVQPNNTTRIIETRLLIKKGEEWIFANYIWNEDQSEAFYTEEGSTTDITWKEGDVEKSTSYIIPTHADCFTCHKNFDKATPIGPKPQNLNKNFTYADGSKNQLAKWVEAGYLDSNYPADIVTTIDWQDQSKPLELRARSYLDINCAHCHSEGKHCDYRPLRLAFPETLNNHVNMGVCVQTQDPSVSPSMTRIVAPGNPGRSMMYFRLSAENEAVRMPLLGRTLVHEEGLQLIEEWISSLETPCE